MINLKTLVPGLAIAMVIFLSSVPLIRLGSDISEPDGKEYCTATHHSDESGCKADKANDCVWCLARAVPSMCYDLEVAKQLPHSVFKCDFPSTDITESSDVEKV